MFLLSTPSNRGVWGKDIHAMTLALALALELALMVLLLPITLLLLLPISLALMVLLRIPPIPPTCIIEGLIRLIF